MVVGFCPCCELTVVAEPIGVEELVEAGPLLAIARQQSLERETSGTRNDEFVGREGRKNELGLARSNGEPVAAQMVHEPADARRGALLHHHATWPMSLAAISFGTLLRSASVFKRQIKLACTAAGSSSIEPMSSPTSARAQSSVSAMPGVFSSPSRRTSCTNRTTC